MTAPQAAAAGENNAENIKKAEPAGGEKKKEPPADQAQEVQIVKQSPKPAADVAVDSKPDPQVTVSNPVESPAAPEQQQKKSPAKRSADESEKTDTDAPAQDTQESAKPEEPAAKKPAPAEQQPEVEATAAKEKQVRAPAPGMQRRAASCDASAELHTCILHKILCINSYNRHQFATAGCAAMISSEPPPDAPAACAGGRGDCRGGG